MKSFWKKINKKPQKKNKRSMSVSDSGEKWWRSRSSHQGGLSLLEKSSVHLYPAQAVQHLHWVLGASCTQQWADSASTANRDPNLGWVWRHLLRHPFASMWTDLLRWYGMVKLYRARGPRFITGRVCILHSQRRGSVLFSGLDVGLEFLGISCRRYLLHWFWTRSSPIIG